MAERKSAHSGLSKWEIEVDEEASRRLGRVRQKGTRPEQVVRTLLYDLGHRYTLSNRDLPGRPDIANRKRGWVVLVHGCFWHQHTGCKKATVPKTNRGFWKEKFQANQARDRRAIESLRRQNIRLIVVWECETEDIRTLRTRLKSLLVDRLP